MTEQLAFDGTSRILGLTERQQHALELIERLGGASLDEVGAAMHERRGKHSADYRCEWCADEGAAVAHELRRKRLVTRVTGGVWVSTRPLDAAASPPGAGAAASSGAGVGEQAVTGAAGAKHPPFCASQAAGLLPQRSPVASGESGGEPDGCRGSRAPARSDDPEAEAGDPWNGGKGEIPF